VRSLLPLAAAWLFMGSAAARGTSGPSGPAPPRAQIACAAVAEPGRVRCEVEVRPAAGRALKWGDVVVVETPSFALPLRARVGPGEATTREEGVWRWALALAASARGRGEVRVRVRTVTCLAAGDACVGDEVEAKGAIAVGE
jgi:hypothetical protein